MPDVLLQPILVNTGAGDEEGQLIVADGRLIAVLVCLADPVHGVLVGRWFMESGFGPCADAAGSLFDSLDAARAWVLGRLGWPGP